MQNALAELLSAKVSPSAKVLALHLARTLKPGVTSMFPRIESDAIKISRNEYERAYRECFKMGWVASLSPTKVEMRGDALPRRALAEMLPTICAPTVLATDANPPSSTAKQETLHEDWSRDHGETPREAVRGRGVQAARSPRSA
jgi:DNA-binding transcriptional MocR family regulator